MMSSPRVFHGLVNYGGQAGVFSKELRQLGYQSFSAVSSERFSRSVDFILPHWRNSFLDKVMSPWRIAIRFSWFFKFDIFHFYFGRTLLPYQLDLPLYSFFGKRVVMEYLGSDVQEYQRSIDQYGKFTNVGFYFKDGPRHDMRIKKRRAYEKKYIDLELVCAPYLSEFVPGSKVLPLALDLSIYEPRPLELDGKIRILHAPTHRGNKGSDYIIEAVERLQKEGEDIDFVLVESMSHADLIEEYKKCHLFIDQIAGGWYGTASIEAMACAKPVVCFYREDYLKYIDYGDQIPLINANIDSIYKVLRSTIENKSNLRKIGLSSREFVLNVHDVKKITSRLIELYSVIDQESKTK
jgi:glycosyltransferase involved in cell wall biosynthesis